MKNPFQFETHPQALRLIPEIDQNPRFIEQAQRPLGKLILLALMLTILASFGPGYHDLNIVNLPFALALAGLLFLDRLGQWKFPIILGLLFLTSFHRDFFLPSSQIEFVARAYMEIRDFHSRQLFNPLAFRGLILGGLFAGGLILWRFLIFIKAQVPVLWLLLFWFIALAVANLLPIDFPGYALIWAMALQFVYLVPTIPYLILSDLGIERISLLQRGFFSVQSLLISSHFVFIRSPRTLLARPSESEMAICRLKALKLFFWIRIILFFRDLVRHLFFSEYANPLFLRMGLPSLDWPTFRTLGFVHYNALHLPAWQTWIVILLNTFLFILTISVTSGVAITFFRLGGMYLLRGVCRPYLAKTFNEYYRRWLFYYSEAINHLFFNPFYRVFHRWPLPRSFRFFLALFSAVFLGGALFHVMMIGDQFLFYGPESTFDLILGWIPYFMIISLACCVSASGVASKMRLFRWPQPLRIGILFFINASLATCFQYYPNETWASRLEFWRSLLSF